VDPQPNLQVQLIYPFEILASYTRSYDKC